MSSGDFGRPAFTLITSVDTKRHWLLSWTLIGLLFDYIYNMSCFTSFYAVILDTTVEGWFRTWLTGLKWLRDQDYRGRPKWSLSILSSLCVHEPLLVGPDESHLILSVEHSQFVSQSAAHCASRTPRDCVISIDHAIFRHSWGCR